MCGRPVRCVYGLLLLFVVCKAAESAVLLVDDYLGFLVFGQFFGEVDGFVLRIEQLYGLCAAGYFNLPPVFVPALGDVIGFVARGFFVGCGARFRAAGGINEF